MFYYGFLIDNNPQNAVYVKLWFNKDDPLASVKANMIGTSADSEIKTFRYFENYSTENESKNDKLLSYLRLIECKETLNIFGPYLNPPVKDTKVCTFTKRKLKCPPLTIENEKAMLMKFKAIANESLKKFPDSYETDIKMLKESKSLSFNQRNILIYRSGEKKV